MNTEFDKHLIELSGGKENIPAGRFVCGGFDKNAFHQNIFSARNEGDVLEKSPVLCLYARYRLEEFTGHAI